MSKCKLCCCWTFPNSIPIPKLPLNSILTTITTMLHAVLWSVDVESSAAAQQHNSGNQLGTICIKAVVNTTISASAAWEQWLQTKDWILLNIVMSGWRGGVQRPGAAAGGGGAVQPAGLRHLGGEQRLVIDAIHSRAVNEGPVRSSRMFFDCSNIYIVVNGSIIPPVPQLGPWSPCSVSCGIGVQSRLVACRQLSGERGSRWVQFISI